MVISYVGFWGALIFAPIFDRRTQLLVERTLIRPLYGRDPLYSLSLTFGLANVLEDGTRYIWGAQTLPFGVPSWLVAPLSAQYFFLTGYRLSMVAIVIVDRS